MFRSLHHRPDDDETRALRRRLVAVRARAEALLEETGADMLRDRVRDVGRLCAEAEHWIEASPGAATTTLLLATVKLDVLEHLVDVFPSIDIP